MTGLTADSQGSICQRLSESLPVCSSQYTPESEGVAHTLIAISGIADAPYLTPMTVDPHVGQNCKQ